MPLNGQIIFWTPERVAILEKHAGYLSCAQIANEIGCGVTRNAVIGKMARLGIKGRPLSVSNSQKGIPKPRKKPAAPRFKPVPEFIEPEPVPFLGSREIPFCDRVIGVECAFVTSTAPATVCGCEVIAGESWCAYHKSVVFIPREQRKSREKQRREREAA